jgi:hypothetical protein
VSAATSLTHLVQPGGVPVPEGGEVERADIRDVPAGVRGLHDGEWMGNADEIGSTNGSQLLAGLGA